MQYAVVDCRWALDDPASGYREYLAGHIPGAAFLDVERDLSGRPGAGGRHPLPDPAAFARAAGGAGIGPGVFPENAASLALHARCGFRVVGTRERIGELDGVWRDVVLLERRSPVRD